MIKILFVCLGNICRSPLAEAIFKDKIKQQQLQEHFQVDSVGIGPWHVGSAPDPRTIRVAQENGIPIDHMGRQFSARDSDHDYILVMDGSNLTDVLQRMGSKHKGLYLMRHFDPKEKDANVPDPYHGTEEDFREVYEILDRSCEQLITFLKEKHQL